MLLVFLTSCNERVEEKEFIEIQKEELSNISPTPGGDITIPLTNFETINPLYPNNSSVYYFNKLIYDSLFEFNEEGGLEPVLVEHYIVSPDNTTITITLKDNIYWHDGTKLTTDDILATFEFIKNNEVKSSYYDTFVKSVGYGNTFNPESFLTMEIFDERNIDLHFDNPYAEKLEMLTFPILSQKEIESYSDTSSPEEIKLIGTGPYKLKEIVRGTQINLERNENYYGNLPYIDNVNGKIFNNEDLALLSFETGLINIVRSNNYDWAKYQDNPNIKIEEYNSNEMDMLIFNNGRSKFQGEVGKKIKQSISRGINKKRIIDRLFLGKAVETSIPLNINKMNLYGLKSDTYYNEEISKEILNDIGYTKLNDNGFLVNEQGETIDIEISTNFSNNEKRIIADFIIQDLRAIGINAYSNFTISANDQLSVEEINELNTSFRNSLESGSFDLAIISVNLTDTSDMSVLLHTNAIGNGLNYGYYSNSNLDQIFNKLKLTNDFEKQKELYLDGIDIFVNDMPIVPLYTKINALLIDNKIQNEIKPINSDIYRSFSNLFILKQFQ